MEHEEQGQFRRLDKEDLDLDSVAQFYEKARSDSLLIENAPLGRIQILGEDRLDLLERLSTNTFKHRSPGDYVLTALLEANGRLIDLLEVFVFDDHLIAACSPGRAETVSDWFIRHIFFQDDVSVESLDPWAAALLAYGPNSSELLEAGLGARPAIEPSRFTALPGALILPAGLPDLPAYRLFIDNQEIAEHLRSAEQYHVDAAARNAAEALRVEVGVPRRGQEIIPGIIPLGAGLTEAISFTKGCYIGQEVIARLDSRGILASELSGVRLSKPAPPGSRLTQAGKEIGTLTSSAYSPANGWIGLALIKTRRLDRTSGDLAIQGAHLTLEKLPFAIR